MTAWRDFVQPVTGFQVASVQYGVTPPSGSPPGPAPAPPSTQSLPAPGGSPGSRPPAPGAAASARSHTPPRRAPGPSRTLPIALVHLGRVGAAEARPFS